MDDLDFDVARSWATEPLFYRAPVPELPPGWHVMEFQLAGVEYHLNRNHAIFGDQPGLTKSAQSVLLSNAIRAKRNLVVCPASLRLNWQREIWRWTTTENVKTYPVMKAGDGISSQHDWVIISYDLLRSGPILDALLDLRWDHVILDEAHYLKDPKGNKRTRAICAPDCIPSVAGRITLATGTLMPNQPIEAYNAIRLLNWDAIGRVSLEGFREYYYDEGGGMVRGPVWVDDAKGGHWESKLHFSNKVRNVPRNLADLQYRLRKHLMVRRLKEDVLHELPVKQWHPFPLSVDADIRKAMAHPGWKMAEKLYEMDAHTFDTGIPVDGMVSTARRLMGEAKAPAVAAYISDMLESGVEKIIVSAWHKSVLEILWKKLHHHGAVFMGEGVSMAKRQAIVDKFQEDPRVRIILGQMISMGVGWTLTAAQDAVLAEPDWVPGNNDQFIDRIHRMGQKGAYVRGHVPVVPGTLDERILGTAIQKDQNIYQAMDAR